MSVAARGRRQPQLPPRRGVSLTLNSDEPPAKPAPARSRPRVPAHDAQPPRTGGANDEQRSPRQLPVLPPKSSTPTAAAAPSHDSVSPRTMDKKQRLEILRKKKAELAARRAAVEAKREQLSDDADVEQPDETRSSPRADAIEALDVLLNANDDEADSQPTDIKQAPPIDAMSALDALLDDD